MAEYVAQTTTCLRQKLSDASTLKQVLLEHRP